MLKMIRITFYTILLLFILDIFDFFQTKIEFLKSLVYFGVIIIPIPLLIMEFKPNRNLIKSILIKVIPILTIFGLLCLNPFKIIFNKATWKTQTVKLINEKMTNHKVEFQMKDLGALGYAKRTSEVFYISKYFYFVWTDKYENRNFLGHKWKRVDQDLNEIGLK